MKDCDPKISHLQVLIKDQWLLKILISQWPCLALLKPEFVILFLALEFYSSVCYRSQYKEIYLCSVGTKNTGKYKIQKIMEYHKNSDT